MSSLHNAPPERPAQSRLQEPTHSLPVRSRRLLGDQLALQSSWPTSARAPSAGPLLRPSCARPSRSHFLCALPCRGGAPGGFQVCRAAWSLPAFIPPSARHQAANVQVGDHFDPALVELRVAKVVVGDEIPAERLHAPLPLPRAASTAAVSKTLA